MTTNYDEVSANYDGRYQRHDYPGLATAIQQFVGAAPCRVLELGSGTGHWIGMLLGLGHGAVGIEPSQGMIDKARAKVPASAIVLGRAEQLPFGDGSFDRVIAINAVHHFGDLPAALREAKRVLRPDGALMVAGLDPRVGIASWAIYEYFEGTAARDLVRFPSINDLRTMMARAGFVRCATTVAERIVHEREARAAIAMGALHKHSTSQLSELSDDAYQRGIAAIEAGAAAAEARGKVLTLHTDLQIHATVGFSGG